MSPAPSRTLAVGEGVACTGLEVAFGGHAVGEQHVVARQLDMIVGDRMPLDLRDRAAVDQVADRDQHILDEHRVIGRQQQFAPRRGDGRSS